MAILIGILDDKSDTVPYLVEVTEYGKTKHSTIIQYISKVTNQLFGYIDIDMFSLIITDGASYILKAGKISKEIYPSLLRVTCRDDKIIIVWYNYCNYIYVNCVLLK